MTVYALLAAAGYVLVLAFFLHYSRQNSGGGR
jgi:hypothetical protein